MNEQTHISNVIHEVGDKAKYDAGIKKILGDKTILAWIMKHTVIEFREYSIEEIRECIEGEPEISTVRVRPGHTPEAIQGMNTEDKVPGEGTVTYDIKFYAITPDKKRMRLILNVEAQKDFYPGYDLVTRAVFYCARMISAQMDTEFVHPHYDDIKKVYSIWICIDTPKYARNTITEYKMEPQSIFGEYKGKARYDLLSVVMICLGDDESNDNQLIGMLETLLSDKLSPDEKEEVLETKYQIKTSIERKGDINTMCNLSERIEERGIAKGIEQGRIIVIQKLLSKGISCEEVAELLDMEVQNIVNIQGVNQ